MECPARRTGPRGEELIFFPFVVLAGKRLVWIVFFVGGTKEGARFAGLFTSCLLLPLLEAQLFFLSFLVAGSAASCHFHLDRGIRPADRVRGARRRFQAGACIHTIARGGHPQQAASSNLAEASTLAIRGSPEDSGSHTRGTMCSITRSRNVPGFFTVLPAGLAPAAKTATAATVSAATEAVSAATALFTRACFVDVHGAAVEFCAIQSVDCVGRFARIGHLNERKASRLARISIANDADLLDGTVSCKGGLKLVLCGLVGKVSYKNIRHFSLLSEAAVPQRWVTVELVLAEGTLGKQAKVSKKVKAACAATAIVSPLPLRSPATGEVLLNYGIAYICLHRRARNQSNRPARNASRRSLEVLNT